MAGFVIKQVLLPAAKQTIKKAPYYLWKGYTKASAVTPSPTQFIRGVVKSEPKYYPFAGGVGKQANVSASFTAGRQVRYIANATVQRIVYKGPTSLVAGVKYIARTTVRDSIISPIYTPIYQGYGHAKVFLQSRGTSGPVVRYLDPLFMRVNRNLDKVGLAPTGRSFVGSLARGAAYATIYYGVSSALDAANETYQLSQRYFPRGEQVGVIVVPPSSVRGMDVPSPALPIGPAPVVGNNPAPAAPVPARPVDTPQSRQRTYIPYGGRR